MTHRQRMKFIRARLVQAFGRGAVFHYVLRQRDNGDLSISTLHGEGDDFFDSYPLGTLKARDVSQEPDAELDIYVYRGVGSQQELDDYAYVKLEAGEPIWIKTTGNSVIWERDAQEVSHEG